VLLSVDAMKREITPVLTAFLHTSN